MVADIETIERKIESTKTKLKKRPLIYILLVILLFYISFFGGAFLHESKIIQKFNIFPVWFGTIDVSVDPSFSPIVKDNATIIPFSIKNVGDKDINNLAVTYTFCGLPPKKATLQKNTLYQNEPSGFNLETDILLNTSCQIYTDKVWSDVYLDSENNCYLDVPQSVTNNYCEFCKVQFDIYANGKEIHKELWYPYLGDSFDTTAYITNVLTRTNLTINWAEGYNSTCRVLVPWSGKEGLIKKDKIALTFFDAWTMCERGDDVEWCKQNYSRNIYNIITRYRDAYNTAGYSSDRLYFILVSQYDTSNSEDKKIALEADLVNLTVNTSIANVEIGMIKLRSIVNDTNGTYTSWNNTYTIDGIHPSKAGALEFATYMWNQIVKGLANQNSSRNGIDWIADSYKVSNTSLDNPGLLFNNTGLLKSYVQVYNLTNALLYLDNYSVIGSGNLFSNDLNINFTLNPGRGIFVLNWFNLTEGANRNNTPIWFSSVSTTSKNIASNLTGIVNISVLFNTDSCMTIQSISYSSHSGNYSKTYLTGEYECSNSIVNLNVTGLEQASGSNTISISYTTSAATASTGSSGSAAIISLTPDNLKDGYKRTFFKKWSLKFLLNNELHSLVLDDINNNSVVVTVSSEPITEEIFLGNTGKFDMDVDGYYDLQVEVNEIAASKLSAVLTIKSINEKIPTDKTSEGFFDIPVEPEKLPSFVLSVLAVVLVIIFFAILWLLKSRSKRAKR